MNSFHPATEKQRVNGSLCRFTHTIQFTASIHRPKHGHIPFVTITKDAWISATPKSGIKARIYTVAKIRCKNKNRNSFPVQSIFKSTHSNASPMRDCTKNPDRSKARICSLYRKHFQIQCRTLATEKCLNHHQI